MLLRLAILASAVSLSGAAYASAATPTTARLSVGASTTRTWRSSAVVPRGADVVLYSVRLNGKAIESGDFADDRAYLYENGVVVRVSFAPGHPFTFTVASLRARPVRVTVRYRVVRRSDLSSLGS